jgi:hypothetical protein
MRIYSYEKTCLELCPRIKCDRSDKKTKHSHVDFRNEKLKKDIFAHKKLGEGVKKYLFSRADTVM